MKSRKPNFGVEEVRFLLSEIKERRNVLFGPLSSRLTSQDKKRQWLEIANELGKYGWVRREWEDLRKKWQDLQALTKEKHRKRSKTGEGSVNWTPVDDLVVEVLGSDNPKLVAIPGGLDTSCIAEDTTSSTFSRMPIRIEDRAAEICTTPDDGMPGVPSTTPHPTRAGCEWAIPIKKR